METEVFFFLIQVFYSLKWRSSENKKKEEKKEEKEKKKKEEEEEERKGRSSEPGKKRMLIGQEWLEGHVINSEIL